MAASSTSTPSKTAGELAGEQAETQGIAGRLFSFKLDGVVVPREADAQIVDSAQIVELVEVTDYDYPESNHG